MSPRRGSAGIRIVVLSLGIFFLAGCGAPAVSPLDGDWVVRFRDQNLAVLRLDSATGKGMLHRPREITMNNEGYFTRVGSEVSHSIITGAETKNDSGMVQVLLQLEGSEDSEQMLFRLIQAGRAELRPPDFPEWMPAFIFVRPEQGNDLTVATDWSEPPLDSPELERVRDRLLQMAEADQVPRQKIPMDLAGIAEVDAAHLPEIERIHAAYGWPGYRLLGYNAAHAFFLLVQHQGPELQRRLLPELEQLVDIGEASRQDYSFLFDRVMLGQGKPQRWGNGAVCVEGQIILQQPVEDPEQLDERRAKLHLPPIAEYLPMMAEQCTASVQ